MPNGTSGTGTGTSGATGEGGRRARLAAPGIVGLLAAVITGVTTSLDALELPGPAQLMVTGGVAALAGVAAWAAQPPGPGDGGGRREVAGRPPAQLPPVIAHFTGRGEPLDALRRAVADGTASPASPLVVSLHGPAGVGKSALAARFAHEIADDYPDGRLYFDLRGAGDARVRPEEVLIGFLQALGVRLATDPGGLPELQKLWWTWTRGLRLLVLLDNARDGDQVKALLPPGGGSVVLVTSRQPLHLRGTFDRRLPEFSAADAVELLGLLAGRERILADPDAAAEIADLCGYLPLAVGICGGRLAARESWTPRAMADRLQDERRRRLDELETAREIDKSVRASLALSYDDCSRTQRRLLRTLGLLAVPDVQAWAAGALLGVSDLEGDDQLEALVDAQLVECSGTDATGAMRYRLHDLVRLYAQERGRAGGHRGRAGRGGRARPGRLPRARRAGRGEPLAAGLAARGRAGAGAGVLGGGLAEQRAAGRPRAAGPGRGPRDVGAGLAARPGVLLDLPLAARVLAGVARGGRGDSPGRGAHGRRALAGHRAAGALVGGGQPGPHGERVCRCVRRARAVYQQPRDVVASPRAAHDGCVPAGRGQPRRGPALPA
ncbi:AAA family ATPase [Actinomadura litoris]|uniref:AAA family ATPase n=1 Tax=Actinomadura litoris TaxID=2678616 RepID=UPI001FA7468C|nr:AAA family ATPase [Actinomadura litoris]